MLYRGSPCGAEAIRIYDLTTQICRFEERRIEAPHPGVEPQAQWLTIRRDKPDYVALRGGGVMNPVALKTATRVGFPVDRIVGAVWSNSEEDVLPAGEAAIGNAALAT